MSQATDDGTQTGTAGFSMRNLRSRYAQTFALLNAQGVIPAGQSIEDLLEDVSALTRTANDLVLDIVMGETPGQGVDPQHLCAVNYLLNIAHALNQAAMCAVHAPEPAPTDASESGGIA